jgi:hypothetical protein
LLALRVERRHLLLARRRYRLDTLLALRLDRRDGLLGGLAGGERRHGEAKGERESEHETHDRQRA